MWAYYISLLLVYSPIITQKQGTPMATKANVSSIDTSNGDKLAYYAKSQLLAEKSPHKGKTTESEQIINARKAVNLAKSKAKAKKKAKMAKASRKKNKK